MKNFDIIEKLSCALASSPVSHESSQSAFLTNWWEGKYLLG